MKIQSAFQYHMITPDERKNFERILTKRKVVFAWSYEDMPGLAEIS